MIGKCWETGLHYNWHRSYDPTLGRYIQADPLGFPDGPSRYAYAVNSPQVYVDPSGQFVPTPSMAPKPPNEAERFIPCTPENPRGEDDGATPAASPYEDLPCWMFHLVSNGNNGPCMGGGGSRGGGGKSAKDFGPSGKPKFHNKDFPTRKRAKDAARNSGDGAPTNHPSPKRGKPHYHGTKSGKKKSDGTHYNYPKR